MINKMKKFESILKLSSQERYKYFIKKIVDAEEVWGLYDNGWALAGANDDLNQITFPLWPSEEFAKNCAINGWNNYKPEAIKLDNLLSELLPKLKQDNILPAIFPYISMNGITPEIVEFIDDINEEKKWYA
jgi:lantibiotic modifying enzyme